MTDEELVKKYIGERIDRGLQIYGPLNLDTDKRDLIQEALEEVLDEAVYTACKLIQIQRGLGIDPRAL